MLIVKVSLVASGSRKIRFRDLRILQNQHQTFDGLADQRDGVYDHTNSVQIVLHRQKFFVKFKIT